MLRVIVSGFVAGLDYLPPIIMLIENQLDKLLYETECNGDAAATSSMPNADAEHRTNEDDAQQEALLQQLQAMDIADEGAVVAASAWSQCLKRLPLKAAISHIMLLCSLSAYCAFGGLVRTKRN